MRFLHQMCSIALIAIGICCCSIIQAGGQILICQYNCEESNTPDEARFTVEDVDTKLCTHLVYCRINLDIETNKMRYSHVLKQGNEKIFALKKRNPQFKVLIALNLQPHSWDETHVKLMANKSYVDVMVSNVVEFLQQHELDGVNFEFSPLAIEKVGFMSMVNALKKSFKTHEYLLSHVGHKNQSKINEGYEFPNLSRDLDFLILDAYDFDGYINEPKKADHDAPLYNRPWDIENKSVDFVVSHWIKKGFPPNKIILTIPLSGHSWTLSSNDSTPPAPARGRGPPQKYTKRSGLMSYLEICHALKTENWQVFQDPGKRMGPYAVSPERENKTWVSYDDPTMATIKSEYILAKELGGAAVVDISYEDFRNRCGGGNNPMLTAIQKTLAPGWTSSSPKMSVPSLFLFVIALLFTANFQVV